MNAPESNRPSSKPNRAIAILSVALICLAIGAAAAYWKLRVKSDEEHEPKNVKLVVAFRGVGFAPDKIKNRDAFVAALANNKVVFRHKMVIRDKNSLNPCDKDSLPDTLNITDPDPPDPCDEHSDVGQQVTQRVGFNNLSNLEAALAALESSL